MVTIIIMCDSYSCMCQSVTSASVSPLQTVVKAGTVDHGWSVLVSQPVVNQSASSQPVTPSGGHQRLVGVY